MVTELEKMDGIAQGVEVLYVDDHLLVANKPKNLCTDPHRKCPTSLYEILRKDYPTYGYSHRIDRNTSGIVIGGLTKEAKGNLTRMFAERKLKKQYLAMVPGEIDTYLNIDYALDPSKQKTQVIKDKSGKGKLSRTECLVITDLMNEGTPQNIVAVRLHTGRKHQIRAHLSSVGFPIYGDKKYGWRCQQNTLATNEGQYLHAANIIFPHPITQEEMSFTTLPNWVPQDKQDEVEYTINYLSGLKEFSPLGIAV